MATITGRNMQEAKVFIIQKIYILLHALVGLVSHNKLHNY